MTIVAVHGNGVSSSSTQEVPALGRIERAAAGAVVALVVLLGVIGAVNSFRAVAEAVEPSFGGLAWTVPVGVDVGIAVFTALDLLLARVGMRMSWLRLVPGVLVATTIYLNVAGERDPVAAVAHGVLPALWVIAVEAGSHVVRTHVGLTSSAGVERMDRVRWSRWLLAPASTLRLWRRMVLWETRSYSEALRRERARLLARTELQDRWGRLVWRWRAPRRERALYRLGELAPAGALAQPESERASVERRRPSPDSRPSGAGPGPVDVVGCRCPMATWRRPAARSPTSWRAAARHSPGPRWRPGSGPEDCPCRTPGWAPSWPSCGPGRWPCRTSPWGWRDGSERQAGGLRPTCGRRGSVDRREAGRHGWRTTSARTASCRRSTADRRTWRTTAVRCRRRPGRWIGAVRPAVDRGPGTRRRPGSRTVRRIRTARGGPDGDGPHDGDGGPPVPGRSGPASDAVPDRACPRTGHPSSAGRAVGCPRRSPVVARLDGASACGGRRVASYQSRVGAFHGLRVPEYAVRAVRWAPRGVSRAAVGLSRWSSDAEGRELRWSAAARDDAREYLHLSRQRNQRVHNRVPVVVALVVLVGGSGAGRRRRLTRVARDPGLVRGGADRGARGG